MQYTREEATELLTLVSRAPLQNITEAKRAMQLMSKFAKWHEGLPTKHTIAKPEGHDSSVDTSAADPAEAPLEL